MGGGEHLLNLIYKGVVAAIDDLADACVDNELGAGEARRDGDIDGAAGDAVAVVGGLANSVLLGVGAEALFEVIAAFCGGGATWATAIEAVLDAARRAVVAGRKDVIILHDDRAHMATAAVRALSDDLCNLHKVLVPTWARIKFFLLCGHWGYIIPYFCRAV